MGSTGQRSGPGGATAAGSSGPTQAYGGPGGYAQPGPGYGAAVSSTQSGAYGGTTGPATGSQPPAGRPPATEPSGAFGAGPASPSGGPGTGPVRAAGPQSPGPYGATTEGSADEGATGPAAPHPATPHPGTTYQGATPAGASYQGATYQGATTPGAAANADNERARAALNRLRAEVGKVVVGQDPAVTGLVIALLCRGHVLLEGVPGVAKTLMVRALSASLDLDTKRLQFTPDLMPGDVTGSLVYDARNAEFSFRPGPVFTNLLLADEINRTPPKTQASLLEAMEERQVTIDGEPRPLPDPFLVVATQNPIEFEGTYPLPEAQLDRFLLKLTVPLPSRDEEFRVLNNHHRGFDPRDLRAAGVTTVADAGDLAAGRAAVRGVQAAAEVLAYVVDLCRATRQSPSLSMGASPRGATALLSTAKAWAWLSGRDYVTPDDVKALARPTLRHRVAVRPEAELEGVTADGVLDSVLASVPAPR